VRTEDAFDVQGLAAWLRVRRPGLEGVPAVRQFPGGASNLTYELRYPDQTLILRRPPSGYRARSAHDMAREYDIQHALRPFYPYVPEMVARCDDSRLIGSDFYVMTKVEGLILRKDPPSDVVLSSAGTRQMCTSVIDRLVDLHQVDIELAGLDRLSRGDGYVARQVGGWSERYRRAKTWNVPSFESTMRWLEANQPGDSARCLIHNDFRFDNVVLDRSDLTRVLGVLDWEMATVGDPLMDVGGALAYWVERDDDVVMRRLRRQPTHLPGMLTRADVWRYYSSQAGIEVANPLFYEVFGLFRLAVIAQQIYYRYHHRQTRNPAYRTFYSLVTYLHWRCRRILTRARRERTLS
jgi:aminoglycoside phosphotransferase (APT) family kinase protein